MTRNNPEGIPEENMMTKYMMICKYSIYCKSHYAYSHLKVVDILLKTTVPCLWYKQILDIQLKTH